MRKINIPSIKFFCVNESDSAERLRRAYFRILGAAKQQVLKKRIVFTIKPLRFRKVTIAGSCII